MSNDQENSFQNKRKRSNSIHINSDSDNDEVSGSSKSIINASCIISSLSNINKSTKSTASYLSTQSDVNFTYAVLCPQPDSITTVKKNANKQHNMYKYHDEITSIEIDSVNYKLGFFGCNIPFSIVESEHFKDFCQASRPTYKPPSRKVLSSHLLNEVHNNICSSLRFRSDSVLLIDGWKNEAANTKIVA